MINITISKGEKVAKLLSIIAGNSKEVYNDTLISEAITKGFDIHDIDTVEDYYDDLEQERLWYSTEVMIN